MWAVARMIRQHFDGVLAWVYSRQTNGFLEVGLGQNGCWDVDGST